MGKAASNINAISARMKALPTEIVKEGTQQIQKPVLARFTRDSGGNRKLSGLRNSATFSIPTSVKGSTFVVGNVKVGPSAMRGPAAWLERGTKARPQGNGFHPGTRGKRSWSEPVAVEIPRVRQKIQSQFKSAVGGG